MNKLIFIVVFCLMATGIFSQKILVVENVNSLKNFKYHQGEDILLKFTGSEGRVTDRIFDLSDSTVILEKMGEVRMRDISCIYRDNWLIQILSGLSLTGGVAYFGIDSFNRLTHHENPVIDTGTFLISSGMVAFSFALIPLRYRKINTEGRWKLRMIDMNSF